MLVYDKINQEYYGNFVTPLNAKPFNLFLITDLTSEMLARFI